MRTDTSRELSIYTLTALGLTFYAFVAWFVVL
jgi:hypothetical protein